jgi:ADP-heptose:LPS heptosyltransferase
LPDPVDYVYRDFVVLSALGIERKATPIELEETSEGREFRRKLRSAFDLPESSRLLGLNIGCGTPDATCKRPSLSLLSALTDQVQQRHRFDLLLTGAPFESEINKEFRKIHEKRNNFRILDLAGKTNLFELAGAIKACELFISSDSGPYHMAVGLHIPTLAIFRFPSSAHYHDHPWVRCLVAKDDNSLPELMEAAEALLSTDLSAGRSALSSHCDSLV